MDQRHIAFVMCHVARAAERTAEQDGGMRDFAADLWEMVLALRAVPTGPPGYCEWTDKDTCLYHPLGGPDCVIT